MPEEKGVQGPASGVGWTSSTFSGSTELSQEALYWGLESSSKRQGLELLETVCFFKSLNVEGG